MIAPLLASTAHPLARSAVRTQKSTVQRQYEYSNISDEKPFGINKLIRMEIRPRIAGKESAPQSRLRIPSCCTES
jgi:hypothetical protein